MIIGRPQHKSEHKQQQYMVEHIQPLTSTIVMEILETKPADPIPKMYNLLHRITEKREQEKETEAQETRGPLLCDEQWEQYKELMDRKKELEEELENEVINIGAVLERETYK